MDDTCNNEQIRKEAQEILKKFSKALEKVKLKEKKAKGEAGGWREEGEGMKADKDFRKQMFANAPSKDDDFIIAEKKRW